eukprot:jgi/Mesvir1/27952/Mv20159-RA.2
MGTPVTPSGRPRASTSPLSSRQRHRLSGNRNDLRRGNGDRVYRPRPSEGIPHTGADTSPPPTSGAPSQTGGDDDETPAAFTQTFVWGTNVNVEDTIHKFELFFNNFMDKTTAEPLYPLLLEELDETQRSTLNLDCRNLHEYDSKLYDMLVNYPVEIIPCIDVAANRVLETILQKEPTASIKVHPFNLISPVNLRDLNPSDIEKLVCIKGMIIRASPVIPELKHVVFRCNVCGKCTEPAQVDNGQVHEPRRCPEEECRAQQSMELIHNYCKFADKQLVRMQERPESIPDGETPHSVTMCVFDELVDGAMPGDRVEATGVFRAMPVRVNPNQRTVKSIYKTYLDVVHLKKNDKNRLMAEDPDMAAAEGNESNEFYPRVRDLDTTKRNAEEKARRLKEISQRPNIYEELTESLAPSIWELTDVKKGLLCQLFGGTNKDFSGVTGAGSVRGEMNVLLCGDPGTSKSQLLQYVHKISPRGIYTSGRGSSAVGLTAYVTKDPETKEAVLESGALVLSDRGTCCIDEFDKMSEAARSMLHEVMEQQTVSVAKAGIICTLNARTSVLASANPVDSRYNPRLSVVDNIKLPPTLMSRFDLIYLVLDKPDEANDRRLARHLVSLHFAEADMAKPPIDQATLAQYISYAREHVHPVLSDAAAEDLVMAYGELRMMGSHKKVITATPRQLESLIRISEALAKMRFADTVEREDVAEALRLLRAAMQQSATDPTTGTIDMDAIITGTSASSRARREELKALLRQVVMDLAPGASLGVNALKERLKAEHGQEPTNNEMWEALQQLSKEEDVQFSHGEVRKRL